LKHFAVFCQNRRDLQVGIKKGFVLTDDGEVVGDEGRAEGGRVCGHLAAVVASQAEAHVLQPHSVAVRLLLLRNLSRPTLIFASRKWISLKFKPGHSHR